MEPAWLSFVPDYLARELLTSPGDAPVGRAQQFEAIVLFADISGFVALSVSLGRAGPAGTEELTALLNAYFDPMIELVHHFGGTVGKFGGDALTVLFPCTRVNRRATARRAVQCALAMQARMPDFAAVTTSAGVFTLTLTIGLASGPVLTTVVGDPALRLEYIVAGSALDRAAAAEQQGSPGDVLLHRDLLPLVDGGAAAEPGPAPYLRIRRLEPPARLRPLPPLPQQLPAGTRAILEAFQHPAIAQRLSRARQSLINEHRQVTLLFVQFADFAYDDDPRAASELQQYLNSVIWTISRYDGYLRQVDMGDKGSKYIVLFGAPTSHENDIERALRCALELRAASHRPVRIGMNSGFEYCGLIGSQRRREYAVVGEAINVAARLMQAARPGQILVGGATQAAAGSLFRWEALPPLRVKGKAEPVAAWELRGPAAPQPLQQPATPLVGRSAELNQLSGLLGRALAGQGQVVGLVAEAGMGKTRLATGVVELAAQRGCAWFSGECVSYGSSSSYLVWRSILRGLFALDAGWSEAEQVQQVQQQLEQLDPQLAARAPLLGVILGLRMADNELTRAMDARLRKTSLHNLVVEYLHRRARTTALLLIFDDCHWIDPLSHELLEVVGWSIIDLPVLLLALYRPPEVSAFRPRFSTMGHFSEVRLAELSSADQEQLLDLKLAAPGAVSGALTLDSTLRARILARAAGNPLYLDELVALVADQRNGQNVAVAPSDLPESLQTLIISRIDRLPEGPKTVLKVASVIGRVFRADWIWGAYPPAGNPEQVRRDLATLCNWELLQPTGQPAGDYAFKHILTRDVTYESLAVATRELLHTAVAEFIERSYSGNLAAWYDALAYHYGQTRRSDHQREYYRRAGAAAQAAYANDAAIDYYRRLLPLLGPDEQIAVILDLGAVWQVVGCWREAETLYRQSLAWQAARDRRAQARLRRALGEVLLLQGRYADALSALEQAHLQFDTDGDLQNAGATLRLIGNVHVQRGAYDTALLCYENSLDSAVVSGDRRAAGQVIADMGDLYVYQGEYTLALECYERRLHQLAENEDLRQVGHTIADMGLAYWHLGNAAGALFCFAQQMQVGAEIGDRWLVSLACGHMADVYRHQGAIQQALACSLRHLQLAVDIGDRQGMALAAADIGAAYFTQGQLSIAERLFSQAVALGRALDIPYHLSDFLYLHAELLATQEQYAAALELAAEACSIADRIGHKALQVRTRILVAHLQLALGMHDVAAAVAVCEQLLTNWPEPRDQALIMLALWRLEPQGDDRRDAAARLYRTLYTRTPHAEFRARYAELTGETLPEPPELPALPALVTHEPVHLELLLIQVDQTITRSYAA